MNNAVLLISVLTVTAYVCRLTMLKVGQNSFPIIVMHICLAMSAGWSGYHAAIDLVDFQDIVSLLGAAAWIVVSFNSWKDGVPKHFTRHPVELPESEWGKVHGGKKEF